MCNTALLWALWDPSCNWELCWLILKLVCDVIAPLARPGSVSQSFQGSSRSMAPKTVAQRGFWHMIWIHHEHKSVSYGAREVWEAGSIFSNLRCSVGFVICLFSMKLDWNSILLAGEAAAEVGHGNTAVAFVCANTCCTCSKTTSNTTLRACVHVCRCTQFQQRVTAFVLSGHSLTFPLFHFFFFLFCSHMEPAESQAEYVQVSLLRPGVCASLCAIVLSSSVCLCPWTCGMIVQISALFSATFQLFPPIIISNFCLLVSSFSVTRVTPEMPADMSCSFLACMSNSLWISSSPTLLNHSFLLWALRCNCGSLLAPSLQQLCSFRQAHSAFSLIQSAI